MTGPDVPASSDRHPNTRVLRGLRPVGAWLVRRRYDVRVRAWDVAGNVAQANAPVTIENGV